MLDLLKVVLMPVVLLSLVLALLDSHRHPNLLLIIFSITYHPARAA